MLTPNTPEKPETPPPSVPPSENPGEIKPPIAEPTKADGCCDMPSDKPGQRA